MKLDFPLVVGTISTPPGLAHLDRYSKDADWLELRADALLNAGIPPESLIPRLKHRQTPVLLTLRSRKEGGLFQWHSQERGYLYLELLPFVDAIDLELASLRSLYPVYQEAHRQKKRVILSAHAFGKFPGEAKLRAWTQSFRRHRAFVYKIASHLETAPHLRALARPLFDFPKNPWALMGMGPRAASSRLALAALGSRLMYGYLDHPAAPGQPSAKELMAWKKSQ